MNQRFLFAWELGANFGHFSRLLPIANILRNKGNDILFAVRDTQGAAHILTEKDYKFVQAPFGSLKLKLPPANYSEILLTEGYANPVTLLSKVHAWKTIYDTYSPDVVITDHAPTALLSAKALQIPAMPIGNGFQVPPCTSPLPSIRPWEKIPEKRLLGADQIVLTAVNKILNLFNRPSREKLAGFFSEHALLATFPELDHYGIRTDACYTGAIYTDTLGEQIKWPDSNKKKIFAYLQPSIPGFEALLQALHDGDADVVCAVPHLDKKQMAQYTRDGFILLDKLVAIPPLLDNADLVISYCGAGTMTPALLRGVPLLLVPQVVEQYLIGKRVEALGAAILMQQSRSTDDFKQAINHLLTNDQFKKSAHKFATQHVLFSMNDAANNAAQIISTFTNNKN